MSTNNDFSLGTRSSSSLPTHDDGIQSPLKRRRLAEDVDFKMQEIAAAHLLPPTSFSSSSSTPTLALYAGPPISSQSRPRKKTVAAAAAPDAPICPYKKAATRTEWQISPTGVSRTFAVHDKVLPIESIGRGTSFQCFKFGDREVIKIFIAFSDPIEARKQSVKPSNYDRRMDFLRKNFELCKSLNIESAHIINFETLKSDGYVLQEYLDPIEISWSAYSGDLSDAQTAILNQFLDVLGKAFCHHQHKCWDLVPKNFGLKDSSQLVFFDFSDQPIQIDQWLQFPEAARGWANDNPSAQKFIANYLQNCLTDPSLIHVQGKIQTLIGILNWQ